jgi:hypothetical protein
MVGYRGYPELRLNDDEGDRDRDKLRDGAMPGGDGGGSGQGTSNIDEIVDLASSGTLGDGILAKICDFTVGGEIIGREEISNVVLPGGE